MFMFMTNNVDMIEHARMTPCVTYVGVGAREGRDLIAVSGRGRGPAPPSRPMRPHRQKV